MSYWLQLKVELHETAPPYGVRCGAMFQHAPAIENSMRSPNVYSENHLHTLICWMRIIRNYFLSCAAFSSCYSWGHLSLLWGSTDISHALRWTMHSFNELNTQSTIFVKKNLENAMNYMRGPETSDSHEDPIICPQLARCYCMKEHGNM